MQGRQVDVRTHAPGDLDEVDKHDEGRDHGQGHAEGAGLLDQHIALDTAEAHAADRQGDDPGNSSGDHATRAFCHRKAGQGRAPRGFSAMKTSLSAIAAAPNGRTYCSRLSQPFQALAATTI